MNNVDLIRSCYAAFQRGDMKTIFDALDPAIDWVSNGDDKVIPWAGRRRGVEGAAAFFQALGEALDFELFEPQDFHLSGDTVAVVGRTRARVRASGGRFDSAWAHVFTVRNGRLVAFREFYDTLSIAGALRGAGA